MVKGAGSSSRGTVPYVRRRVPIHILRGFCMGVADIIPGVSGGTVALLLGIYDRLVEQISTASSGISRLARGDIAGCKQRFRAVQWSFLASLLLGITLALLLLASWLRTQIHERPVIVSSAFFGVIAASAFATRREVRKWAPPLYLTFGICAVATFTLLGIRSGSLENPAPLVAICAGAIAICAMILPGISGSFVLLMLGLYDHLIAALEQRDPSVLGMYAVGALIGLLLFSRVLNRLLNRYRDLVVSMLLGLMVGSLRVLWPWPSDQGGLENTGLGTPQIEELLGALIAALVGVAAVVVILVLVANRENFDSDDALEMP